jgi:surface antigen
VRRATAIPSIPAASYHGSGSASRRLPLALALLVALATGGCGSMSSLSSLIPGFQEDMAAIAPQDTTGSLALRDRARTMDMTKADWTVAQAALREALGRKEDGTSLEWQNPITRSRGTVSPMAAAFVEGGFHCRNFLVSHRRSDQENWYEGTACRTHRGQWDVQKTRPVQKS